jgi:excinuclease ABC subunit C
MEFARRQGQTKSEELAAAGEGIAARTAKPLLEVQQALGLNFLPRLIAAFDISNLSGTDSVGSAVCFKDGRPYKTGYRQFKMAAAGPNDAGMIQELLERYLAHLSERSLPFPGLLLVDGGLPQLGAAVKARNQSGHDLAVAGLAKRLEEIYLESGEVVSLPRHSAGLHLLQRLRDEAHRFAQRYHHKLREKRVGVSGLQRIKGIGPATVRKLLRAFGSAQRVREAGLDELEGVVGKKLAQTIRDGSE